MASHVLDQALTKAIASEIEGIIPYDEIEVVHRRDAMEWVASAQNIFRLKKPDIPPTHLVAYFVFVDPDQQSILLVDHIKAQLWIPTGGHVEFNEDPRQTVMREAKEELGVQAVFLRNNDHPFFITRNRTTGLTPGHTDISLWYLLRGSVHDFHPYDKGEFNDIEWYSFAEVLDSDPAIFDRHLQRFVRKLRAYLGK